MLLCLMLVGIGCMHADNTMIIENLSGKKGTQVVLPILLNNTDEITAFSFELHLPEGVTVAKNERGKFLVQNTDRADDQSISSNLSEGVYYIATLSLSKAPYWDNSGAVCNITLDIAEDALVGNQTIELKNIVLSTPETQKIKPANASCTLSIENLVCATPTITFRDGKFCFECAAEGVTFDVTSSMGLGGTLTSANNTLPLTITLNVVASKDGYVNSETVSKTFTAEDLLGLKGDMDDDKKLTLKDVTKFVEVLLGK